MDLLLKPVLITNTGLKWNAHLGSGRGRPRCPCPPPQIPLGFGDGRRLRVTNAALFSNPTISNHTSQSLLSSSTGLPFTPSLNPSAQPQFALLALLFVLSAAIGAIFSLALISLPTIFAFKKCGASVHKLSQVVSQEVPGTLSSLKLSALEINQLTRQLSILREKIYATRTGNNKVRTSSND